MKHIKTIIRKEWAEVFKNRMVLFTMIFMPLIFTILPLVMLYFTGQGGMGDMAGAVDTADVPVEFLSQCSAGMNGMECMQIYMINEFLLLFMMIPVIIPVTIAAYSIVGEESDPQSGTAPGYPDHDLRTSGREESGCGPAGDHGRLVVVRPFSLVHCL